MVLPSIAQALGLRERPGRHYAEQLRSFLDGKHLLLVLDNFEHLLAAGADVAALLTAAPRVKALVTNRAPLRVMGERELPVLPMSLAGGQATLAELVASDAGRLFVERAREHDPAFRLDEETAPLIADICARLDSLPLAMELASARVKILPPRLLHARLTHRLRLLTRGALDAPARHGTMRDAIAWSYDLLSAPEQRLFRRLAVFEGGFTLDAAGWMASVAALSSSPDDLDWVTLGLFRDQAHWHERALGKQEAARAHDRVRLLVGYAAMLTVQGRFAEAETRLAEVLSFGEADFDPLDRARALFFRAGVQFGLGQYDVAEELLREAYALAERFDDPILRAAVAGRALANLSMCSRGKADFARDMAFSEEALRLYEGKQLDLAESISLLDLGAAAFAAGDYQLAVERWREGVTLAGEHGDLRQVADALSGIANVAVVWGASGAALLLFGAAEALCERMGTTMLWPLDIAAAEQSLTALRQSLGEQEVADGLRQGHTLSLAEAMTIAAKLSSPTGEARVEAASTGGLTRRERDVLRQMAEHKTDQEIAAAHFLSRRTVNWHVRSILTKLDARSRGDAVFKARANGLI